MDEKSFDYLKHTAMKLVSSRIDSVVDRIQKGTPKNEETNTTAIHGINSVLSFYADNARDVEVTPIDEVNEIMDGTIIKVSGGFNVFCSNSNYYLFKQSIQKNITTNERKRLEKEIGKYIFKEDVESLDNGLVHALVSNGLTQRKPYSKSDFSLLLYNKLYEDSPDSKQLLSDFKEKIGKPTKTFLNGMGFDELYHCAETTLGINLFSPFFERGYEMNTDTNYRINKAIDIPTVLNYLAEYKEREANIFIGDIEQIINRLSQISIAIDALDKEKLSLDVFSKKADLKDELVPLYKNYEKEILSFQMQDYFNENEKYSFYTEVAVTSFSCPDDIESKYTKLSLADSSYFHNTFEQNKEFFSHFDIETETKKVIYDYGVKRDLKNLVLYAESLIDITNDVMTKKKKVEEFEKTNKNGESKQQGFAL